MAKHIVTNVTDGPKVLNSSPAIVLQAGGTTDEPVEISAEELASAKGTGWFEFADDADDEAPALDKMTVAELKAFAEANGIDLGDATKKDDILSAIELATEAKD